MGATDPYEQLLAERCNPRTSKSAVYPCKHRANLSHKYRAFNQIIIRRTCTVNVSHPKQHATRGSHARDNNTGLIIQIEHSGNQAQSKPDRNRRVAGWQKEKDQEQKGQHRWYRQREVYGNHISESGERIKNIPEIAQIGWQLAKVSWWIAKEGETVAWCRAWLQANFAPKRNKSRRNGWQNVVSKQQWDAADSSQPLHPEHQRERDSEQDPISSGGHWARRHRKIRFDSHSHPRGRQGVFES